MSVGDLKNSSLVSEAIIIKNFSKIPTGSEINGIFLIWYAAYDAYYAANDVWYDAYYAANDVWYAAIVVYHAVYYEYKISSNKSVYKIRFM